MEDRCVCCNAVIPEGRIVCPTCAAGNVRKREKPKKGWLRRMIRRAAKGFEGLRVWIMDK